MKKKQSVILGISPGTKEIGLAVIRGSELMFWRTKTFPGPWSVEKLERILAAIDKVSTFYEITGISMKIPDPAKSSEALNEVILRINGYAKESDFKCAEFSLNDLKELFIGSAKSTKKELVPIAGLYNELLLKVKTWDTRYHIKTLEAVALARMANNCK